jgi:hypothetical protein
VRGALVTLDSVALVPTVITFQYNPHTLTRSYEVRSGVGGPESGQITGPPNESIQVELVLDANDAKEAGEGADGVAPQLAALVGLVTPTSAAARSMLELAAAGSIEVFPPPGPITLFVWGAKRVDPVAVTELSISEESHDARLHPVLARVSLGMRVLTYTDLAVGHPGHALSLAGQIAREQLAATSTSSSLAAALGTDVQLI